MVERLDIVELGEAGFRHHIERLAGGIRQEMQVELLHLRSAFNKSGYRFCASKARPTKNICLWKNMGKGLAEASGQTQAQESSRVRAIPSTIGRTREKFCPQHVDRGDGARESAESRESRHVKLLAKFVRGNKPRSSDPY